MSDMAFGVVAIPKRITKPVVTQSSWLEVAKSIIEPGFADSLSLPEIARQLMMDGETELARHLYGHIERLETLTRLAGTK